MALIPRKRMSSDLLDPEPREGSFNGVTSDGVFKSTGKAIDNILDDGSASETIVVAVPVSQSINYTVGNYYEVQGKVARLRTKTDGDDVTQLTFDTTSGILDAVNGVVEDIASIGSPLQWKGTATIAQLNAGITGIQPGWTYTMTDAGTLTDGSIEVEIGDEVAWTEDDEWFKVGYNLSKDDLLKVTAQNALAGNLAPEFDPTKTGENDDQYHVGDCVAYQGEYYEFMVNHYGAWSSAAVKKLSVADMVSRLSKKLYTLINENFVRSTPINLIKRDFLIKGQYVDGSGVIKDSADWNRTDFIPVASGEPYKGSGVGLSAFYDENYNFISGVSGSNMTTGVTAPEGAAFLVCSITNANSPTCVLVHGTTIPQNAGDGFENFVDAFHKIFDPIFNSSQSIFAWTGITFDKTNYTVTFPARTVLQSLLTGKYCLINASAAKTYTLADGHRLVLNCDFNKDKSVTNFDEVVSDVAVVTATNYVTLFGRLSSSLYSDIPQYQGKINTSGIEVSVAPDPPVIVEKLSELAPNTWALLKAQSKDVNIVMIGDSLSTALGYEATDRPDAKYRPPLMTEFTYPSYIEEQLRWDGQVYNRFDVDGVFTETCTSAENLTEDTDHWDWADSNNRPALTRCLSGTNCSVSYEMDEEYVRTDYIYRTDCTNPASASVSISAGNGKVLVYDEANASWVEANGFSFSAQESSEPIISSYNSNPLMKSMYQKRLKMKWAGAPVADCVITITNNGAGRLTYWGIQKGKRPYMLNFINSSRGGHSTMRLKPFEAWDVDYWQPSLILWEPPYFNHSCVDICGADYVPLTSRKTTDALVAQMQPYAEDLLEKSYSPELVAWSMWVASQASVHSIDQEGNWLFGVATDGTYISAVMYINAIYTMLKSMNVKYINFVPLFRAYGFKYAAYRGIQNYETATTIASGKTGKTWTFDGGHLNDFGHELFFKMFGAFFME